MSNEKTFILRKPLTALMTTVSLGALSLSLAGEVRGTLTPTAEDGISEGLAAENQQYSGTLIVAVSEMLAATASSGVPQGFTEEEWLAANAEVSVSNVEADSYTITLEASNLVPNGLYTVWWIKDQVVGVDMGPAGGTPNNQFRADSEGNVTTTITVPAGNDYQKLGFAYHADDQTTVITPSKWAKSLSDTSWASS
jgi:hypothetical protein